MSSDGQRSLDGTRKQEIALACFRWSHAVHALLRQICLIDFDYNIAPVIFEMSKHAQQGNVGKALLGIEMTRKDGSRAMKCHLERKRHVMSATAEPEAHITVALAALRIPAYRFQSI